MPVKLILFIVCLIFVTIFAGFNAKNVCNVSIIFKEFTDVPVFVTALIAFVLGIIVSIPFFFGKNKKRDFDKKITDDLNTGNRTLFKKDDTILNKD